MRAKNVSTGCYWARAGLEALTRTCTNCYYLGGQRVALRQGVIGQARVVY